MMRSRLFRSAAMSATACLQTGRTLTRPSLAQTTACRCVASTQVIHTDSLATLTSITPWGGALCLSRRFIARVGPTVASVTDEGGEAQEEEEEEVIIETRHAPSGVTTVKKKKSKPRTYVNADGYNVVEDASGAHAPGTHSETRDGEEAPTVEFTVTEGEHLEKLFRRPVVSHKYLSEKDSSALSKMLFESCYKDEMNGVNKEALLYQASLELVWLEEWADGLLKAQQSPCQPNDAADPTANSTPVVRTADDVRKLIKRSVIERVDLHKPLSYITGSQPFFGCDIACRPPLLCPRPETEMWTHWLVSTHLSAITRASPSSSSPPPSLRVLDMCSGTGCIGVAIAKHIPSAEVLSIDLLDQAVHVTRENARRNGIPDERLHAIQSDLFDYFLEPTEEASGDPTGTRVVRRKVKAEFLHSFDVIVSNPPYVLPEQYVDLPRTITLWESKMALVGDDVREHKQHLYFQELCEYGHQLLKTPGQRYPALREAPNMVIEVGLQAHLVASLMEKSELFTNVELHTDYAQQERWVSATSTAKPGSL